MSRVRFWTRALFGLGIAAMMLWVVPTGMSTVFAASTGCGTTNVALNHTAMASSIEAASTPASAAFDGNTGTRWSSLYSDPQWIAVDLGSTQSICQVVLRWETAYGRSFQIQTSSDNANWTSIYSTTAGTGGTQTLSVTGAGRYVRMYGSTRSTVYGYSLWEFAIYAGGAGPTPTPGARGRAPALRRRHAKGR